MTRFKWIAAVALPVALAALGGCSKREAGVGTVGGQAPAFTALDLNGKPVALADLRGKVAVLNEWATWCEPCRGEIPQLEALHKQYAAQGLVLVGVSIDAFGTGGDVADFARTHDMSYTIWLDPDKSFATKFFTIGVPETFVIDKKGVVTHRHIGALHDGDTTLAGAIRAALAAH